MRKWLLKVGTKWMLKNVNSLLAKAIKQDDVEAAHAIIVKALPWVEAVEDASGIAAEHLRDAEIATADGTLDKDEIGQFIRKGEIALKNFNKGF